jgi:hypothetical protein
MCRKQHHPAASGGSGHPRAGPGQRRPGPSTQPDHLLLALGWPLQPPHPLSYRPISGLLAWPRCKERGHSLFGELLFTEKLSLARLAFLRSDLTLLARCEPGRTLS